EPEPVTAGAGDGAGKTFTGLPLKGAGAGALETNSGCGGAPGALSATGAGAPLSSIVATAAPIARVSPSLATVFKIPAFSAVSSKVALSDSSSAITSSICTASPSFFFQLARVTSVIDSPTGGTLIVKLI